MWPFKKKKIKPTEKALSQVDSDRGWITVMESYGGAWQANVELELGDLTKHPTVYSCVSLIAGDIAKLPIRLIGKNSDGMWTPVEHPVFNRVLQRPNKFQGNLQFLLSWVNSLLLYGNAYILKTRDPGGRITGLTVLETSRVTPLVSDDGSIWYQLRQDHLGLVHEDIPTCPAYEIIHDRVSPLFHPLVGVSPLWAAGLSATSGIRAGQNTARLYENGARPCGVLTAPGQIKKETADRLRKNWNENYSGANYAKVAVLSDGLHYNPLAMTAKDSQQVETLKLTNEDICRAFKVPAFKVGVGQIPGDQSVEQLNSIYYSDTVQVLIESIEYCLTQGLELPKDMAVELDLDGLLRTDQKTKMETLAAGVKAGILAPNEARRGLNLPPVDGGEFPLAQQQNWSLASLAQREANNPWGAENERTE